MTTNDEYVKALHAELAYVKAQPNVRDDRVSDIEAEIARVTPAEPADEVEHAVDEAPENTAGRASRAKKK